MSTSLFRELKPSPTLAILVVWALLIFCTQQLAFAQQTTGSVDYAKDVLPIFKAKCYGCHSIQKQESNYRLDIREIALKGGDFEEPPIVPGKADESTILRYVSREDEDTAMPPTDEGDPLSKAEVQILRGWIESGANWPDKLAGDVSKKLSTDHWSFQPIHRPQLPAVRNGNSKSNVRNPIDLFVLKKLQSRGLEFNELADERIAIRRLFLDHLGLPPSVEELDRFLESDEPYELRIEKAIEFVLASPHFGERWARHWLDIIKFAETTGFETNRERTNAFPYRDYVIDSLNTDLPYDQFIRDQIAGDVLGDPLGTGFLVAGPNDIVKSSDINLTLMQRQDELADIVNTTSTAFLGLTVGCARCHNHKFDPISQKDFYALQAVFAGVNHANRNLGLSVRQTEEIQSLDQSIAKVRRKLDPFVADSTESFIILDDDSAVTSMDERGVRTLEKIAGRGVNPAGTDPGSRDALQNLSGGKYSWWQGKQGKSVASYQPIAKGRFRVWLSWGAGYSTHSENATYWLDRDGDLSTQSDQKRLATVNQKRFANAQRKQNLGNKNQEKSSNTTLVNQALWSGFFDAGTHLFSPQTTIILKAGDNTATTADVVILEKAERTNAQLQINTIKLPINAKRNQESFAPVNAKFVRMTITATNASQPCIDEFEVWSQGTNVGLASNGSIPSSSSNLPGYDIHKLKHVNDGKYGNMHSWISNESGKGWVQIELSKVAKIDRVVWGRDREGQYSDRVATAYRIEVAEKLGEWKTVADSSEHLPTLAAKTKVKYDFQNEELSKQSRRDGKGQYAELQRLMQLRNSLNAQKVAYVGTFSQPGATHRLYRGDPLAKREIVAPDGLEVMTSFNLATNAREQDRRVKLAEWIANEQNPLTARIIVNRIWQHHFGAGLVGTPSDFGAMGSKPSHPELLDWLASELITHDWSTKHIHRLILQSHTYLQSSEPSEKGLRIDAGSQLLWRFPPRRLSAESIRDSILVASQSLNKQMGGRGFSVFEVSMENVRHYFPRKNWTPDSWRRMIYMTKVRQEQDATFGNFDCPDGGQNISKRSRSTTPLQALNLLNSPFVLQQADRLAKRLKEHSGDRRQQIVFAFKILHARVPTDREIQLSMKLIEENDLMAFCRAMYNTNEFLFIF